MKNTITRKYIIRPDNMRFIYFVGTAGSGKSTLVQAYKEWLEYNGIDAITMNLDPGSDTIPYEADIDIREWINLQEVMDQYNLGPNGAQIVAADLIAVNVEKLVDAVSGYKTKYVLIDTPGQMELFAFRESSVKLVEALGKEKSMVVYTSDPLLYRSPNGFVSGMMLGMLVQYRMQLPMINILTKSDVLSEEERERLIEYVSTFSSLLLSRGVNVSLRGNGRSAGNGKFIKVEKGSGRGHSLTLDLALSEIKISGSDGLPRPEIKDDRALPVLFSVSLGDMEREDFLLSSEGRIFLLKGKGGKDVFILEGDNE